MLTVKIKELGLTDNQLQGLFVFSIEQASALGKTAVSCCVHTEENNCYAKQYGFGWVWYDKKTNEVVERVTWDCRNQKNWAPYFID